jgi:hypothetical protein
MPYKTATLFNSPLITDYGPMEQFINHPELIRQLGERSRKIAEEKYDVHKVNEVILRAMGLF